MPKNVFIPEGLYGIIGQPLQHSLSPLIHNWGFQLLGIKAAYYRWPVDTSGLENLVLAARSLPISGLSVTIPHKQAIIPFLDGCSRHALLAGAVNTVYWLEESLWGENSDIQGFLSPWSADQWRAQDNILILGNGGAARAALAGLQFVGARNVQITGRDSRRSTALAAEFAVTSLSWAERGTWSGNLLINATPLGMAGKFSDLNPWPEGVGLQGIKTVYDLVYNPLLTPLLRAARSAGVGVISGLEMFLGQACAQFALWTGEELPLHELRCLVTENL